MSNFFSYILKVISIQLFFNAAMLTPLGRNNSHLKKGSFSLQSAYSENVQQHMMHVCKDAPVHFIWWQSEILMLQ